MRGYKSLEEALGKPLLTMKERREYLIKSAVTQQENITDTLAVL